MRRRCCCGECDIQASFNYLLPNPDTEPTNIVYFTDTSTSSRTITDWDWDFGYMAAGSTLQNPNYTYPSGNASYTVTLTVTDSAGCQDVTQRTFQFTDCEYLPFHWKVDFKNWADTTVEVIEGQGQFFEGRPNAQPIYCNPGDYEVANQIPRWLCWGPLSGCPHTNPNGQPNNTCAGISRWDFSKANGGGGYEVEYQGLSAQDPTWMTQDIVPYDEYSCGGVHDQTPQVPGHIDDLTSQAKTLDILMVGSPCSFAIGGSQGSSYGITAVIGEYDDVVTPDDIYFAVHPFSFNPNHKRFARFDITFALQPGQHVSEVGQVEMGGIFTVSSGGIANQLISVHRLRPGTCTLVENSIDYTPHPQMWITPNG